MNSYKPGICLNSISCRARVVYINTITWNFPPYILLALSLLALSSSDFFIESTRYLLPPSFSSWRTKNVLNQHWNRRSWNTHITFNLHRSYGHQNSKYFPQQCPYFQLFQHYVTLLGIQWSFWALIWTDL